VPKRSRSSGGVLSIKWRPQSTAEAMAVPYRETVSGSDPQFPNRLPYSFVINNSLPRRTSWPLLIVPSG
jgi:hypothetical protein